MSVNRNVTVPVGAWAAGGFAAGAGTERLVLGEDGPLEAPKLFSRLEPELLVEQAAAGLVGVERLGLPPAAVEGQHQLPAEALAERVLADESLELGDELGMTAQLEVGVDALLESGEALLLEAGTLVTRERGVELGQRGAAPQGQRVPEQPGRLGRRRGPGRRDRLPRSASRSSSPSATRIRYPGGWVTITSWPSVLRSCETCTWTAVETVSGGSSPQISSIRRFRGTASFACRSSRARSARCLAPPELEDLALLLDLEWPEDAELHALCALPLAGR